MSIAENLDYAYRQILSTPEVDKETAIWNDLLTPLGRGETFAETLRFFTTRLDDVVNKLKHITAQNKGAGYIARIENPQLWNSLAWTLIERKLPNIGRELFAAMYEFQLSQQAELRRRIYKGVSLQNLGWANYLLGDETAAQKAILLVLIEETFNSIEMDENSQLRIVAANPAYLMLRQTLRMPGRELRNLIRFARKYGIQYTDRLVYPESCYTAYLQTKGISSVARSVPQSIPCSYFNNIYYSTLVDMLGRATTPETAEPWIKDITSYLFAAVDDFGLCGQATYINSFSLIVRNNISNDRSLSDLGNYLIAEWRYWMSLISVEELLALGSRMRFVGIQTAILFVRDNENSPKLFESNRLKPIIHHLFYQDRLMILTINQSDLIDIERRRTTLLSLIKQRSEALRFNYLGDWERNLGFEGRLDSGLPAELRPQPVMPLSPAPAPMPLPQAQQPMMPMPPAQQMMPQQMHPQQMMPQPMHPQQMMPQQMHPGQQMMQQPMQPQTMMPMQPQTMMPMGPAMHMSPNMPLPPAPPSSMPMSMPPQNMSPNVPKLHIHPQMQMPPQPINPMLNPPVKPPRLVIRNTVSKPRPTPAMENPANNINVYKPILVKSEPPKPEPSLLKPCTTCKNQTSLTCKQCGRPFCNFHINMSDMGCASCAQALTAPVSVEKVVEKPLEKPIEESTAPAPNQVLSDIPPPGDFLDGE